MTSALILLPAIDSDLPLILPLTPTLTLTLILTPIQTLILTLTLTLILGTSTLTSRVARSRRAGAQLARGRYRSFLLPHPSHRPHAALLLPRPLRQALRLERCGCEAAYTGRDAPLGVERRVLLRVAELRAGERRDEQRQRHDQRRDKD